MNRISYIACRRIFQVVPVVAVVAASLPVAGCAGLGLPFGEDPVTVTGATSEDASIAEAGGVATGDLVAIGSAISRVPEPRGAIDLAWQNPDSGSEGRITRLATIDGVPTCRAFRTTVNAVDGLKALSGVACSNREGNWTVEGVSTADDA